MLKTSVSNGSVPQKNIAFAFTFLELEHIKVITKDIGGYAARSVFFFTDTGKVLMKRLRETGADVRNLVEEEKIVVAPPKPQDDQDVVLF